MNASATLAGMTPLRLLFASWYTGLGGGETALLNLANALDPARYELYLLVPREDQLSERWRGHGWQVHILPYRGASTYFVPAIGARFPIVSKIKRLLREQQIHAVYSDYHTLPYALPAAERAGIAALWMCHGWWFHPKIWQRDFFRRPAAGFAASQAVQRGFLGEPPFMSPEQLPVLPLGVDTERFNSSVDGTTVRAELGIASDVPLVAMLARFQTVKGHDVFQAMAKQVGEHSLQARFIVAGDNVHGVSADDAYKARILAAAQADPYLREHLTYLGFRDDVERVIAAADVVVCTSEFESYGMAVLEANACGKPVVSTRRGGPGETILDGETGYLVNAGDSDALAQKVVTLLRDPALRQRMGAAGRKRVEEHYSALAMARVFSQTVERLVAQD
jgi:glycosyltransferase involved in cell wall biosynthesis